MSNRTSIFLALFLLVLSSCTLALEDQPAPGPTTTLEGVPGTESEGREEPPPPPPEPLLGVQLYDVSPLVDAVRNGVVAITVTQVGFDIFNQPFEQQGAGTGIVIDDQGHILTNAHVVEETSQVTVYSQDGTDRQALVVASRPDRDLALIRVENAEGLEPIPMGSSRALEVGDPVVAIGNALGLGNEPTVSVGIVSAQDRVLPTQTGEQLQGLIQTDAAINPGNSGGPLLNAGGEVIGINTAIIQGAQNLGFAISIDSARPVIEGFLSGAGEAFLGVTVADNDPQIARELGLAVDTGAIVVQVQRGSPAEQAGIRQADVIVEAGGQTVDGAQGLMDVLAGFEPGETVAIELVRGEDAITVEATLTSR